MDADSSGLIVTVTGEASEHHAPEEGTVRLSVAADGADRESVVAAVLATHERLAADLKRLAARASSPVGRWSADRVQVSADRPWSQDGARLPLVYRASASLSATFVDFARLGEWLGGVAVLERVNVEGVVWALGEDTERTLVERVRRAAVADAVAKAAVYADALGATSVVAIELADRGLLGEPSPLPKAARAFAVADSAPTASLDPADLVVTASIEARFRAV